MQSFIKCTHCAVDMIELSAADAGVLDAGDACFESGQRVSDRVHIGFGFECSETLSDVALRLAHVRKIDCA